MPTRPTPSRRLISVAGLLAMLASVAPPLSPAIAAATPAAACVLPSDGSVGQLDWETFRRPIGTVQAVMLFVDFVDVPATEPADTLFENVFPPSRSGWLGASSYGKAKLEITPLRHWLRMPEPLSAFQLVNGVLSDDDAARYIGEAIALGDPEVDFSGTQIVYVVPPREARAYPRSNEREYEPEEGFAADGRIIRTIITFGSAVYDRGWRALDHETGHAFGLRDYYNAFGSPTAKYTGAWSLMGDTLAGGDHFAWDKWRMGWLTDSQVRCITAPTRADYTLSPLETNGGIKAVILRTGLRTAIVAEYRTRRGLDGSICSTGVLIYKVNSALKGGAGPIRVSDARPRSAAGSGRCSGELDDAAYRARGRWTDSTSGLSIDVTSLGTTARIRVVRTKTYTPPAVHARTITSTAVLDPIGTITVTATLATTDGFTTCAVNRPVTIQQLKDGEWWTVWTANTDAVGSWTYTFPPESGAYYRLVAPDRYSATYDCAPASAPIALPA